MGDIRNIRPYGYYPPKKIFNVINGKLTEIKKAYRVINSELVVVWDIKDTPPTPVVTGMRTVWKVENVTHTLIFPAVTGIGVDGLIDWGDGTVEQCNSGIAIGHDYAEDGEYTVTVDYPITEIVGRAFYEREDLLEIYISDGVETIGEYGFGMCKQLKNVVLPDGLKTLEAGALYYTSALDTVEIPESVTKIGNACFWVSGITHIVIPEGITTITSMFDHCYNLVDVTLPQSLTNIGSYTFNYCTSLKSIDIPKNVNTILYDAFANTSDITIRIHRSAPPPTGSPWRAVRANVQWVG